MPSLSRSIPPIAMLGLLACSDARLQPIPPAPPPSADNRLAIRGEVCTEPADVTPFPVKILFLFDQSASLQCTDSRNRRFDALRNVLAELAPLPNVSFGFVGFASWARKQPFTQNPDEYGVLLDPSQGLGPATDYQGTLASAVQLLEADMVAVGPAIRARTKYVVVFVSDGIAAPRCLPGCEDDNRVCADGVDNDGDGLTDGQDPDCADLDSDSLHPDNIYPVCNTGADERAEALDDAGEPLYVDMVGLCPEYNQPRQIVQRVEDLMQLKRTYSTGDVRLHTVLMFSPEAIVAEVCTGAWADLLGGDHDQAVTLLRAMAEAGGGTFRDVNLDDEDDSFLSYDYASLRSPYYITEFIARNENAVITLQGPIPDSDADGLADEREAALGTRRHDPDSDDDPEAGLPSGDFYSDLFEVLFAASGFDPTDARVPASPCQGPGGVPEDRDGDGLLDCEEAFLGTDDRLPDTDGDRLLDGLELRVGTDPLTADSLTDLDFDGRLNVEEIRANTDPLVPVADGARPNIVRYRLTDLGEQAVPNAETGADELRHCYDFSVEGMELVVTDQPRDRGRNRIMLHIFGEPLGLSGSRATVRKACVEVRFPGEGRKDPPSGQVDVSQKAWTALYRDFERRWVSLAACLGRPREALGRPDVEDLIELCLPARPQLGRVLFEKEEVVALLRRYVDRELALRLPRVASDLFHPIQSFDPEQHCYRPWEVARVQTLLETLQEACGSCELAAGDGGIDDGGIGDGAP